MRGHKCVYLVPSFQEMRAIDGQFVSQMQSGNALGDAAQDLDDSRAAIASLPEDRGCEEVEDRATLPTAVIGNDWSASSVGRLTGREQMAVWAVQAIWMQNTQQELIASLLIKQSVEWET
jgi:hypothetical protein